MVFSVLTGHSGIFLVIIAGIMVIGFQYASAQPDVTVDILDVTPAEKENRWHVKWNVCSEKYLKNPWFQLRSDVEFFTVGAQGELRHDVCDDVSYQIDANDPDSIEIVHVSKHPNENAILLVSAEKEGFFEKYLVRFKICAGAATIENPSIIASSDVDSQSVSYYSNIGLGSCLDEELRIKVIDIDSISVDFEGASKGYEITGMHGKLIPSWVKGNAKLWSEGKITDSHFIDGIKFLMEQNEITSSEPSNAEHVPGWIRDVSGWWSEGLVSDVEFVSAIKYLVGQNIIRV